MSKIEYPATAQDKIQRIEKSEPEEKSKKKFSTFLVDDDDIEEKEENDPKELCIDSPMALFQKEFLGFDNDQASHGVNPVREAISPEFKPLVATIDHAISNGVTETTVTIQTEDSPFFGTEVSIKRFDTAPLSFQISLSSHPEHQTDFEKQLPILLKQLESKLPNYEIRMSPPYLIVTKKTGETRKRPKRLAPVSAPHQTLT